MTFLSNPEPNGCLRWDVNRAGPVWPPGCVNPAGSFFVPLNQCSNIQMTAILQPGRQGNWIELSGVFDDRHFRQFGQCLRFLRKDIDNCSNIA